LGFHTRDSMAKLFLYPTDFVIDIPKY